MNYENPIIRGFNPDPSICRVGEDYYLVTSSFEYFPGIPIYHSKDLVNWEQIGNCIKDPSELPFEKVGDSGGVWAPTIRYEKGIFYVTATFDAYGNFIMTAEDPAGKWSAPVWVEVGGIDPSLYFEDDKAYYCTNASLHPGKEEITLYEIDTRTGKVLNTIGTLWGGIGGGYLESPHLYHIGAWYYLLCAEGGTNFNHMATVARSSRIEGPYESCPFNPVLTNVHDTSKQVLCAGHADLFCDHKGNWWMVHLGIRLSRRTMGHLGRETFLTPVTWKEEWPFTGHDKKAVIKGEGPLWNAQDSKKVLYTDFSSKAWEPWWLFLRKPEEKCYERGEGKLLLYPSAVGLQDGQNAVFAAVRQLDFAFEMTTALTYEPDTEGAQAGLAVLISSQFHYCFTKKKIGEGCFLVLEKKAEDMQQTACQIPVGPGKLYLKITGEKEWYHFLWSKDGKEYKEAAKASTRFLCCEVAGRCFTGTVAGVYAYAPEDCTKESKKGRVLAEISFFEVK